MNTRRIGILGFGNVTALDMVGPANVFSTANDVERAAGRTAPYEIITLGVTAKPFACDAGIVFVPSRSLADAPALDTLIIPGGSGLREPAPNRAVSRWIAGHADRIRRIASVCTGVFGIAPTGLLDGRRVATHWEFVERLRQRFPRLRVDADALFVKDGRFYTSAGVTSGIDLCLSLVQEDLGGALAQAVARQLVVYLVRTGGQDQYSEPLRFQARSGDRFSELAGWMAGHLRQDLSVEALARRASLCGRHFSRRFKQTFGRSPAAFVESLRLDEARRLLASGRGSLGAVADSAGFSSSDAFRRAFERRFGVNPRAFRDRFLSQRIAS